MKKFLFLFALLFSVVCSARDYILKDLSINEYVRGKDQAEWTQDGAFAFSLMPYYTSYSTAYTITNSAGMIYRYDLINANFLNSWKVNLVGLDTYSDEGYIQQELAEIVPVPLTDGMLVGYDPSTKLLTANLPGIASLTATYMSNSITKRVVFNYPSASTTNITYIGDLDWRNRWIDDFKLFATNRDTNCDLVKRTRNGCTQYQYRNDYMFGGGSGAAFWNSNCFIPGRYLTWYSPWTGYDGNNAWPIGSKVALNAAHYYSGDLGWGSSVPDVAVNINKVYRDANGNATTVKMVRRVKIYQWAMNKGIYTQDELSAVWDVMAFVAEGTIPESSQACIVQGSSTDNILEKNQEWFNPVGLPVFAYTQHDTMNCYLLGGLWKNADGTINPNGTYNSWSFATTDSTREDLLPIFDAGYWHTAHGGDSGRPIFMIFDDNTVFLSHYTYVGGGPNFCRGWRVIRDFCSEMGSTCNLYDILNRTKSIYQPGAVIPSSYTAITPSVALNTNPAYVKFTSVVSGKGPYNGCVYELSTASGNLSQYDGILTNGDKYARIGDVLVVIDSSSGDDTLYYYSSVYNSKTASYDITIEEIEDGLFVYGFVKRN